MFNDNYDVGYYEGVLAGLVQELETARWALYEIRKDSETGRILKSIIFLINTGLLSDGSKGRVNSGMLAGLLVSAGFDRDLALRAIDRLLNIDTESH
ncbi:MAG: hypothetical protein CVU89_11340 [Firmicutes bacterium HGW-Firmicutes-14]|nr:MAG: hypothetical protein CVU89_11340 [Firmicutes bacterium HGW-Firmicutes-14]